MNRYCQLPFGRLHARNPNVVGLARAIDRTPSSVAMKLCNFASLDPAHRQRGIRGLSGASQADRKIWDEFHNDWSELAVESEQLRLATAGDSRTEHRRTRDGSHDIGSNRAEFSGDTERIANVQVRLAQRFFRRSVLASYGDRCCISSIEVRCLLVASHILPWAQYPAHRADPRNGLCLSRIHDAAFDRGLITFDEDTRLVVSNSLSEHFTNSVLNASFRPFVGKAISLPEKFQPESSFLTLHRESVFCG